MAVIFKIWKGMIVVRPGEFKQNVLKVYNDVMLDVFHVGVTGYHVDLYKNMIILVCEKTRSPVAKLLTDNFSEAVTIPFDAQIEALLKRKIKKSFEEKLNLNIILVAKDRDFAEEGTGSSVTVLFLDKNVEEYLKD
ncbi:MAG: hypothetical protein ACI4WG_04375 [Erysipelotrichaceae bacterium]